MAENKSQYWIINNVGKRKNIQTLLQSAYYFGVKGILVVGQTKTFDVIQEQADKFKLNLKRFNSLQDCREYVHEELKAVICGIEILENAMCITECHFKQNTAFLLGNEGSGMSAKQLEYCDQFVYIPQYGGGTASLNVTVAGSIIMHHFNINSS